jgi:hypothetical protein
MTKTYLLDLSSRPGLWHDAALPSGKQTAYPAVSWGRANSLWTQILYKCAIIS